MLSWNFVRVPEAKFQLAILILDVISSVVYFREIILESSQNGSETTPWITGTQHGLGHIVDARRDRLAWSL